MIGYHGQDDRTMMIQQSSNVMLLNDFNYDAQTSLSVGTLYTSLDMAVGILYSCLDIAVCWYSLQWSGHGCLFVFFTVVWTWLSVGILYSCLDMAVYIFSIQININSCMLVLYRVV